jgi:hypothetical protein
MPQQLNASIHYTDENDIEYEVEGVLSPHVDAVICTHNEDCHPEEPSELLRFTVYQDGETTADADEFSDKISTDERLFHDIEQRMLESLDD